MKALVMLMMIVLAGCASRPTLEQLQQDALVTGDWSAVEKREQFLRKIRGRSDVYCPQGTTMVCIDGEGDEDCICARPTASRY